MRIKRYYHIILLLPKDGRRHYSNKHVTNLFISLIQLGSLMALEMVILKYDSFFIPNLAWKRWKKCSLCIPVFDSKQLLHLPNHSSSKIQLKWCVMYFYYWSTFIVCYRNGFLGKVHFTTQNNWRQIHGRYITSCVKYVTYCFCNLECLWIASFSCNFFQCQFLEETKFHKHT